MQEGRTDDARREFNQAVEILLNAPDNTPERARIERRLEELIEAIYRYDLDQVSPAEPDDKVSYDKAPLDGILEMTFPVDPSLRSKVKEQIQATASQLPLEESDAVVGAINFFSDRARQEDCRRGTAAVGPLQAHDRARSGRGRPSPGVDLPGAGRIRVPAARAVEQGRAWGCGSSRNSGARNTG